MDWEIEYRGKTFPVSVNKEDDRFICIVGKKRRRITVSDHDTSRADIRWNGDACEVVAGHIPYDFVVSLWSLVVGSKSSHQRRKTNDQRRSHVIAAPMPCRVVDIYVKKGERVAAGHVVAIVEAMKMQNELHAASAGRVEKVYVQKGMSLEANQPVVLIECDHAG